MMVFLFFYFFIFITNLISYNTSAMWDISRSSSGCQSCNSTVLPFVCKVIIILIVVTVIIIIIIVVGNK